MRLILASASPRRRELLRMLVPAFECEAADIDEAMLCDELPADYVCRMSSEKAARVWVPGSAVLVPIQRLSVMVACCTNPILLPMPRECCAH